MHHPSEAHDERAELLHLAQALDGMVGALHRGHPVPRTDLDHAAAAAKRLWDAVGHDPASEFPDHRRVLMEHAAGAARGEMRDVSIAERAAHRIARDLRARAQALTAAPRAVARELEAMVHGLGSRYARFAVHPMAAA